MFKRIIVTSSLLIAVAGPVAAGAEPARRVTGGPVVGLNIAGLSGEPEIDLLGNALAPQLSARERIAVGAFGALQVSPRFAVRAEVLYSMKGAKSDGADPADPTAFYELRYSTAYVAIPLLAAYCFDYDGEFTPRVFAGPEIDVRLASNVTATAGATDPMGMPQTIDFDEDLADSSAAVDVAVVIGAGVGMPVGGGALVFDVRYAQGITRAIDAHEVTPTQGATLRSDAMRSHVFAVVASYEL